MTNVPEDLGGWISGGISLNDYSSHKLTEWYTDALDKFGQLDETKLGQGPKRYDALSPIMWTEVSEQWCEHELEAFRNELFEIQIRYEALLSAYHPHSPTKEYGRLVERAIRVIEKGHPALRRELLDASDSAYDPRVSLLTAEELEPKDGSIRLSLLAADKSIESAHRSLREAARLIDDIDATNRRGRKTLYAERLVIYYLAKTFEKFHGEGEKASIKLNTFIGEDSSDPNYKFESPFFDFVDGFFRIADPERFKHRNNNSVGKLIKETLKLSHEVQGFEDLADNLDSIDSLRAMKLIIDSSIA